jgi:hypothetical protein
VLVVVADKDGNPVGHVANADRYGTAVHGSGCFVVTVPLERALTSDPKVAVFVGGDYTVVR